LEEDKMKKTLAFVLAATMCLALASCNNGGTSTPGTPDGSGSGSASSSAGTPSGTTGSTKVTLGTGGTSGTYYAVGGVLSTVLNPVMSNVSLDVISTGASKANVWGITDGDCQMAILQGDVLAYAHAGTDLFVGDGADTNSYWVAGLYNETVQIIATTDYTSVEQLKGKTVCVGDVGSGTEFNARQVFEAYGMSFDDISVVNGTFADGVDGIKDGKVDAAFTVAGAPTTAIVDLASSNRFNMISLTDEAVTYLLEKYPFLVRDDLPANTYNGIDYEVTCVAVKAVLVASKDLSEDVVYEFTKTMFENLTSLQGGHDKFNYLSGETALDGANVPLHPGAEKYYKEIGVL